MATHVFACGDAAEDTNNGEDPNNTSGECADPHVIEDDIDEATTWVAQGNGCVDYLVTDAIDVSAALTIEPGVQVEFEEEAGLTVDSDGHLVAEGTADDPIVMRGTSDETAWWHGVALRATEVDHTLDHVHIHNAGIATLNQYFRGFALSIGEPRSDASIRVSVTNSTFSGSEGYGLFVSSNSVITSFSNNTLTGNVEGAASTSFDNAGFFDDTSDYTGNDSDHVLLSYNIDRDVTLQPLSSDARYRIGGQGDDADNHRILVQAALTIEPGVTLELTSMSKLQVRTDGVIVARGNEESPITFTGTREEPGHWEHINFYTSAHDNVFEHVIVEYGGGGLGQYRGLIEVAGGADFPGTLTATNSEFRHSENNGIYVYGMNSEVVNGDICSANLFADNANEDCVVPD